MSKKKILFRIICYEKVGLGHLFRCLALSKSLKKYQIIFFIDDTSTLAKRLLKEKLIPHKVIDRKKMIQSIIKEKPSLVINDILNTKVLDVKPLKSESIKVLNFEDLGAGSKYADLVINELFDIPLLPYKNILWGSKYYFLRDEFCNLKPNRYSKKIKRILLTFGGSDYNNLSINILMAITNICSKNNIIIDIITGPGYQKFDELKNYVKGFKNMNASHNTGVISKFMKKADFAISSNGRTVYELAQLNIPAIVISHHTRELSHSFSSNNDAFISVGKYVKGKTEKKVKSILKELIKKESIRKNLFINLKKYNFDNKSTVINLINKLT